VRKKKEILEVFDVSIVSVTQEDMFRGLEALTEVLCDIRDGLVKSPAEKIREHHLKIPPYVEHDD